MVLFVLSGAGPAQAAPACSYPIKDIAPVQVQAPATLKRGINLSRWWEDDQSQAVSADDIKNIQKLGFDFVRVPLSPAWLAEEDEDKRKEKLAQLRCDVVDLLKQNLAVILDLHAPENFQRDLIQASEREAEWKLETLWKRMQPVLKDLPAPRVLIGLYNEPQIENASWWRIQGQLIKRLRAAFPDSPFIATAGPDGGPWNLELMRPYRDVNTIYDFHFYQPMQFTHHGADWLSFYKPEDKDAAVVYPASPVTQGADRGESMKASAISGWNRSSLAAHVNKASAWAKRNKAKIVCLEFGVYRPYVDGESRNRWLHDMRELLEKEQIPWALWEYSGGFGLINSSGTADAGVAKALDLNHSSGP